MSTWASPQSIHSHAGLHPHATVIIDEAAGQQLAHADYYRGAYRNKPEWQHI